jgi:hypothetical protein
MDPAESQIIRRNNHKVRRRRKPIKGNSKIFESYKEGASNPFKKLTDGFKKIKDGFNKIGQFFKAIGSYFKCGIQRIKSMPSCMPWYLLEVFGQILYLPFRIIFKLCKLQKQERQFWNGVEKVDKVFHNAIGLHIIHYPDDIVNGCYKCKGLVPFPK